MIIRKIFDGSIEDKGMEDGRPRLRWVATTSDIDRDGEIVDSKGWDFEVYKSHNLVFWNHHTRGPDDYAVAKAVGLEQTDSGVNLDLEFMKEGDGNDDQVKKSQGIYRMAKSGFITGGSVGFLPLERPKMREVDGQEVRSFGKKALVEFSLVNIPANPACVQQGLESGVLDKTQDPQLISDVLKLMTEDGKNAKWAAEVDGIIEPYLKTVEIEDEEPGIPIASFELDINKAQAAMDRMAILLAEFDESIEAANDCMKDFNKRLALAENRIEAFAQPSRYSDLLADGQNGNGKRDRAIYDRAVKAIGGK